jgi:ribonuclease Z
LIRLFIAQQANVKLHFLGTTGYHPNNRRQTACLMLPEQGLILDAGTGMFRARDLLRTNTLDVFLSHVHLDHSVGLTFLYDVLCDIPMERVTVHVAAEKIAAIEEHLYNQQLFPVKPNYEIVPLSTSQPISLANQMTVTAIPLEHPGGSHGFRLDWPSGSMAYITDTVASEQAAYLDAIRGVGTLIHECYFPDGWEEKAALTGHSCLTPVAQVAKAVNTQRLFLVHINPLDESDHPLDLDSVAGIFKNVVVAEDQQTIDL